MDKFGQELGRDLSWLLTGGLGTAGTWAAGACGEQFVAQQLEGLGPDWYVTHDVAVGSRGANLDHVVVGPAGPFVLNSKYHGDKPVVVQDEVWVNGRRTGHVEQGRKEAARASVALTTSYGCEVLALSLVAVVSAFFAVARQPQSPTVRVAHATRLVPFLEGLRRPLHPCQVKRLTVCVRDRGTWA